MEQAYCITPLDQQFAAVHSLLRAHAAADPRHKVIAFFTTAR